LVEEKARINDLAILIDPLILKQLNQRLEETKPDLTTKALETFVALLRNRKSANHIDVKLYLLDHSKLMYKL
jgi:hypothetical protein